MRSLHAVSKDTAVPAVGDLETGNLLDRLRTGSRGAWGAFLTRREWGAIDHMKTSGIITSVTFAQSKR